MSSQCGVRHRHPEAGAATLARQADGVAAMAPGDLAHQAEAEADAAIGFAGTSAAVERCEDQFPFGLGDARTAVADVETQWSAASDDEWTRWQRDRVLLQVASKARAGRRERAWEAFSGS